MQSSQTEDPVYSFNDDDDEDEEDGIPTLVDESPKPPHPVVSKPPPFRRESKERKASCSKDINEFNTDDAKAVFTIDGEGFDVILSETKGKLLWSPMSASGWCRKCIACD